MKIINTKSLMVLSLFLTSMIAMPVMVSADDDNKFDLDQLGDNEDIIDSFQGGFGSMLGGLGYAGNLLGQVFLMLFQQAYEDISAREMMSGVYVLSAFNETSTPVRTNDLGSDGVLEYHLLPEDYARLSGISGTAYCVVNKSGSYEYSMTAGAGVTLIIWDNDHSFINAVKKLFNFFKTLEESDLHGEEIPEDLIREGVELIVWFLIHINDIFTGDELFILNPITWQKLEITPIDFQITKTWYHSNNTIIGDGDDDELEVAYPSILGPLNTEADARKDIYMQWLLRNTEVIIPGEKLYWTAFTFDLIEFWMKNFEIHIDITELINIGSGEGGDPAKAFQGCDIEFYLFSHHLAGAFLYNDKFPNDRELSVNYTDTTVTINNEDKDISYPESSELTHRLVLRRVGTYNFISPTKNDDNTISWGLRLQDVNISAVPVGIDLDSYLAAPQENLDYMQFGFTFDPEKNVEGADAVGKIKLDQYFAPWNNNTDPYANADIIDLDMAIIYVSTILHFHLNVATSSDVTPPDANLDDFYDENPNDDDYVKETHELKVGNYLGGSEPLDFVDIAGPYYDYGPEDIASRSRDNASTAIIPLAVWTGEMERHDTFVPPSETDVKPFATDIRLNINFTVVAYAVCYPEFEDGTGIWHDPTFSVFMTFQTPEFWALIVLIAGVGLVGVATILIKRRKDMRV
ncbi:MAG: hypothetical protein ACFFAQ_08920 [Promethearchaeota archaeon]